MNVWRRAELLTGTLQRSSLYLAVFGGICLSAIVVTITLGVVMRYAFGAPLLGVNEIVQLTAVVLVMCALPYCTIREEHVAVDVFENWIGKWGRFIGDVSSRTLSVLVLAILCRRAALRTMDALEYGDATNMLRLPMWPFFMILAAGAGLCMLIFVLQLVIIISKSAE